MTRTHRRTTDERLYQAAQDAFTSEGARPPPDSVSTEQRMRELLISFDGSQYVYNGFRYDNLSDAMAYANLMLARPTQFDKSGDATQRRAFAAPTDAQRTLMATLGIELVDHVYRFEGFRYDSLSDAVAYARQFLPPGPVASKSP